MAQLRDFCGFQWNGKHSSDLNIVRVSEGSRYSENLLPNFQDKTSQMAGSDGTLYWESFYTNKSWTINIAFDNLSETNYRELRQWLNAKDMGELIFDEAPYKAYTVKIQSPPQLKFICFNENGQRIYKGEGTIQFISYFPYAKSAHKYLDEFGEIYTNKSEWKDASRMKSTKGSYDVINSGKIMVYNAGDVETDWELYVPISQLGCPLTQISLEQGEAILYQLQFSNITQQKENDSYLRISSRTNLIEGCDSEKIPTGSLYNQFISAGDFFKIPLEEAKFVINNFPTGSDISLNYDYLYY